MIRFSLRLRGLCNFCCPFCAHKCQDRESDNARVLKSELPTCKACSCTVAALSAGGPAENSKHIRTGDVLFKVNGKGKRVVGLRLQDLGSLLLGPEWDLTIERGGTTAS